LPLLTRPIRALRAVTAGVAPVRRQGKGVERSKSVRACGRPVSPRTWPAGDPAVL